MEKAWLGWQGVGIVCGQEIRAIEGTSVVFAVLGEVKGEKGVSAGAMRN